MAKAGAAWPFGAGISKIWVGDSMIVRLTMRLSFAVLTSLLIARLSRLLRASPSPVFDAAFVMFVM